MHNLIHSQPLLRRKCESQIEELECLNDCNGDNGNCTEISHSDNLVECVCNEGYEGIDCGLNSCLNNCTNRGTCDHSTGICICDIPEESGRKYSEPDCARTVLK